ncbi:hypothetical protein CUMW_082020 [Citrus unshiu]|nr:hypothetical protein CUMW_082020 [Citrus unshiu]
MRRSLIFLLLLTVILSSLPPTSPRASPESGDLALVATLNGTVHLVDTKRGESRWSFSMGKPIYSSFTRNDPDFYVDVGEDWKLYFHRKGIGKMKKPSIDVGEFMRRMPHVWDDDYEIWYYPPDSRDILWQVAFADVEAEFQCQAVVSENHLNSELTADYVGDAGSTLPCGTGASVHRLHDDDLLGFLSVQGKGGGWMSLPPPSGSNPSLGPLDLQFPPFLLRNVETPPLALEPADKGLRSRVQSFIASFIALFFTIGFLFYCSRQDKLNKQHKT